jgi:uncharacterized ferritin-like protein (DUF455 family)
MDTADSLLSRIAIIHLVAEARGVDMNPLTLAKLRTAGDAESTRVLEIIHADEITHVTTGHRWFSWLCAREGLDPVLQFRDEVRRNFHGDLRGPFNVEDRAKAVSEGERERESCSAVSRRDETIRAETIIARNTANSPGPHARLLYRPQGPPPAEAGSVCRFGNR